MVEEYTYHGYTLYVTQYCGNWYGRIKEFPATEFNFYRSLSGLAGAMRRQLDCWIAIGVTI